MPVSVAFIRELENVEPQLRRVLISMLEELERQREESVTKTEFNELKEIVCDLGKTVQELAEAQRRSEERLTRLEETVQELAEAQKRTEEEIAKLVRRMDAFEKRLEAVEDRLEGISNSIGYSLGNTAYKGLPRVLAERYGVEVEGQLVRRYVSVGAKEIQINIYGYARKNGRRLLVLGECKVRPSKREIGRFEKYARRIAEQEGKEVFLVFVGHDFPPKIEELLEEKGIAYFWSYELEG